jgi:hypothetical protein
MIHGKCFTKECMGCTSIEKYLNRMVGNKEHTHKYRVPFCSYINLCIEYPSSPPIILSFCIVCRSILILTLKIIPY